MEDPNEPPDGHTRCRAANGVVTMTEIVFLIEEEPEGGYSARALGESIFTQAEDVESLREMVRDAVRCHFPDDQTRPRMIRLHFVSDEVIAT